MLMSILIEILWNFWDTDAILELLPGLKYRGLGTPPPPSNRSPHFFGGDKLAGDIGSGSKSNVLSDLYKLFSVSLVNWSSLVHVT